MAKFESILTKDGKIEMKKNSLDQTERNDVKKEAKGLQENLKLKVADEIGNTQVDLDATTKAKVTDIVDAIYRLKLLGDGSFKPHIPEPITFTFEDKQFSIEPRSELAILIQSFLFAKWFQDVFKNPDSPDNTSGLDGWIGRSTITAINSYVVGNVVDNYMGIGQNAPTANNGTSLEGVNILPGDGNEIKNQISRIQIPNFTSKNPLISKISTMDLEYNQGQSETTPLWERNILNNTDHSLNTQYTIDTNTKTITFKLLTKSGFKAEETIDMKRFVSYKDGKFIVDPANFLNTFTSMVDKVYDGYIKNEAKKLTKQAEDAEKVRKATEAKEKQAQLDAMKDGVIANIKNTSLVSSLNKVEFDYLTKFDFIKNNKRAKNISKGDGDNLDFASLTDETTFSIDVHDLMTNNTFDITKFVEAIRKEMGISLTFAKQDAEKAKQQKEAEEKQKVVEVLKTSVIRDIRVLNLSPLFTKNEMTVLQDNGLVTDKFQRNKNIMSVKGNDLEFETINWKRFTQDVNNLVVNGKLNISKFVNLIKQRTEIHAAFDKENKRVADSNKAEQVKQAKETITTDGIKLWDLLKEVTNSSYETTTKEFKEILKKFSTISKEITDHKSIYTSINEEFTYNRRLEQLKTIRDKIKEKRAQEKKAQEELDNLLTD